jgi:hypothetical protein
MTRRPPVSRRADARAPAEWCAPPFVILLPLWIDSIPCLNIQWGTQPHLPLLPLSIPGSIKGDEWSKIFKEIFESRSCETDLGMRGFQGTFPLPFPHDGSPSVIFTG